MKPQLEIIRCLASSELQERYIINGTAEEYLLPDELVDDALTFVEDVRAGRRGRDLTRSQRLALENFAEVLQANSQIVRNSTSNADLIRSPEWLVIRDAAQWMLAKLVEPEIPG